MNLATDLDAPKARPNTFLELTRYGRRGKPWLGRLRHHPSPSLRRLPPLVVQLDRRRRRDGHGS
jgi:hypothetical protein